MALHAIITYQTPMSNQAHKARDESAEDDIWSIPALLKELEATAASGQQKAVSVAKKAGLKPVGRPDLNYGMKGNKSGPLEMWFQITATD